MKHPNRNHLRWILVLSLAAAVQPAWSAGPKKITVQQLRELLAADQAAKKSDPDTATDLKQSELTEELSFAVMNDMANMVPGPLTTEQMYVLEARSATLPPPAADLPSAAAPDAAAQQAMLAKAADYVSKTYAQLPHLTATEMTARFQDRIEAPPSSGGGLHSGVKSESDPIFDLYASYVRLMNTKTEQVEIENGLPKEPGKDKTQWGTNGMVASVGPPPNLTTTMQELTSNGSPKFLRWQTVDGKQAAVYSFAVEKKKTHFGILYCCFPQTDTTGTSHISSGQGVSGAGGGKSLYGNMQNSADWHNFKTNAGYHGELFVDPDSGSVVRLITEAEFKPSDFVHSEDIRTDFEPRDIGGKSYIVPIRTFTIAEVVPNGDANAAHYAVRHQMITEDIKDYQLAGATTAQK
jgi:hypothetical protein